MAERFDPRNARDLISSRKAVEIDPAEKANRTIMRQKLLDLKSAFSRLMDLSKKELPEEADELTKDLIGEKDAWGGKMGQINEDKYHDTAAAERDIEQIRDFMSELGDDNLRAQGIDPADPGKAIVDAKAGASAEMASIQESLAKLSVLKADVSGGIERLSELSMQDREEIEELQAQIDQLLDQPGLQEMYAEDLETTREKKKVDKIFSSQAMPKLELYISQTSQNSLDKEVSPGVMREALYLMIKGEAQRLGVEVDQIDSQTVDGILVGMSSIRNGQYTRNDEKPSYTSFGAELNAKNKDYGTGNEAKSVYDRGILIGAALRQIFKTGYTEVAHDIRDLMIALDYNNPDMSHDQGTTSSQRPDLPESSSQVIQSQMEFINFVKTAREAGVLGTERPDRPYEDFQGSKVRPGEPIVVSDASPEDRAKLIEQYQSHKEKIQDIVVAEHESAVDNLKSNIEKRYPQNIDNTMRVLSSSWESTNGKDAIYPEERVRAIIVEYIADTFAAMKVQGDYIINMSSEIGKILQGITSNAQFNVALSEASRSTDQHNRKEKSGFAMGVALRDAIMMNSGEGSDSSKESPIAEIVDAVCAMEGSDLGFVTGSSGLEHYGNRRTAKRVMSSVLPTLNLVRASEGFFDGKLKDKFGDQKSQRMLEVGGFKIDDGGAIIPTKAHGEYPAPYITGATVEQIKSNHRDTVTRTAGEVESGAEQKRQATLAELRQAQELYDSVLEQGNIFENIQKLSRFIEAKRTELDNLPQMLKNAAINARADADEIEDRNFLQKMSPKHKKEAAAAELALDEAIEAQNNPEPIRRRIEAQIDEVEQKIKEFKGVIAKLPPEITSKAELEAARSKAAEQIAQLDKQ